MSQEFVPTFATQSERQRAITFTNFNQLDPNDVTLMRFMQVLRDKYRIENDYSTNDLVLDRTILDLKNKKLMVELKYLNPQYLAHAYMLSGSIRSFAKKNNLVESTLFRYAKLLNKI